MINAEGDVHISNETVQSLGRTNFLDAFFGSIIAIAKPPKSFKPYPHLSSPAPSLRSTPSVQSQEPDYSEPSTFPWDPGDGIELRAHTLRFSDSLTETHRKPRVPMLTDILPDPGYFVAGGIAGVVSRTATAPLDRLKVYLIAQTGVKDQAVRAVQSGDALEATKVVSRPLIEATKALWRMGGIRSMFAGTDVCHIYSRRLLMGTGNGLNVIKVMPESAIKFGSYEVRDGHTPG